MKDFKIAEIVPVMHLEQIRHNHYHMCLAHLLVDKEDERYAAFYRRFYQRMSAEGKFVLMDNGAAEGSQLPVEELVRLYQVINPTEIVLPDTLNNSLDTLRKTLNFIEEYRCLPYRFMGVPQGKNFDEWCMCAEAMMREPRINTIGVSKFLNIATGDEEIRLTACAYLKGMMEFLGRERDIEVHLLGCDEGPAMVRRIQENYPMVRGCDSAFAYIATQAKVEKITDATKRPEGVIDFMTGTVQHDELRERMREFEKVAGVKDNEVAYCWR